MLTRVCSCGCYLFVPQRVSLKFCSKLNDFKFDYHYTTAYLQRPTVGRYKSVQRPTVGRYIHISSDLTRGYKWRRYKL